MSELTDAIKNMFEPIDMDALIRIKCNEHNCWFTVSPADHLKFSHGGCPVCKQAEAEAVRH